MYICNCAIGQVYKGRVREFIPCECLITFTAIVAQCLNHRETMNFHFKKINLPKINFFFEKC